MSSRGLCFLGSGGMVSNPLPDPLNSSRCAITAAFKVVIEPAVLHSATGQRSGRNAEFLSMLTDLGCDALCLHAAYRGYFSPACQGTFVSYPHAVRGGKKSP